MKTLHIPHALSHISEETAVRQLHWIRVGRKEKNNPIHPKPLTVQIFFGNKPTGDAKTK